MVDYLNSLEGKIVGLDFPEFLPGVHVVYAKVKISSSDPMINEEFVHIDLTLLNGYDPKKDFSYLDEIKAENLDRIFKQASDIYLDPEKVQNLSNGKRFESSLG